MSDQQEPDTVTTYGIGMMLGYTGGRARVIRSVGAWLIRHPEVISIGRERGRGGQSLFSRERVQEAIDNSPGRGSPGKPRPTSQHSKGITMNHETAEVAATQTTYTDDQGRTLGKIWEVETSTGPAYVAEVHDWQSGHNDPFEYDPLTVNVYADNGAAVREIVTRIPRHASKAE